MAMDSKTAKAIRELSKALEVGIYTEDKDANVKYKLKILLFKLGLKSAKGQVNNFDSLFGVLKSVTFDMNDLKLWNKIHIDTDSV